MDIESKQTLKFFAVFKSFFLFITLQFLLPPILFLLGRSWVTGQPFNAGIEGNSIVSGWINVLAISVTLLGLILLFLQQNLPLKKAIWYLEKNEIRPWYSDFFYGAGICVCIYPLILLIYGLTSLLLQHFGIDIDTEQVAVKQVKEILDNLPLLISLSICICLFVPCVEELLFRGYFQQWIKKYLVINGAIVVTSIFFATIHLSSEQGYANIPLVLSLFVLSCVFGYVRERRGSLWATIGMHSVFNMISIILIITIQ